MLKRYFIGALVFILLFLSIVGVRVFYLQRSHFFTAEKHFGESNWKLAIREYDMSMHFYIPWSPYIQRSAERLWQIGEMFEKEGRFDWANIAYSSIRSSFYTSRSLYTPGKNWVDRCDDKIADLNVKILVGEGSIKPEETDSERKKFLYVMKVDRAPAPLWSILVELGFLGWIGSVLFIIFKGFDNNGVIKKRTAFYGILSFLLTFTVWVIALLRA